MKKTIQVFTLLFTATLLLWGCSTTENSEPIQENNKIQIVTSMFPMYEITKEIVGDRAELSVMVGPNEDAHHYEPSAKAVANVTEADVFLYSSNEMEFWVESLLSVVENADLKVIEFGQDVDFAVLPEEEHTDTDHDHDHDEGHNHGNLDPHFWLNPVAVEQELHRIVEALVEVDPEGREEYEAAATAFSEELLAMDQDYQEAFKDAKNRSFVVQHQAFGHLANQYHLNQVAIGGLTTEVEPNPNQLAKIVDFVNDQNVPVIYYQSGGTSAIAETIANETDTEVGRLYDLENIPAEYSDAKRPYMEAMKENLEQLKRTVQ